MLKQGSGLAALKLLSAFVQYTRSRTAFTKGISSDIAELGQYQKPSQSYLDLLLWPR